MSELHADADGDAITLDIVLVVEAHVVGAQVAVAVEIVVAAQTVSPVTVGVGQRAVARGRGLELAFPGD